MSDIVERLREIAGPIVPNVCTDAAEAIERLRSRVGQLQADASALAADRDEARRGMCNLLSWEDHHDKFCGSPAEYAKQRGWDCFKEGRT
jgi:hypothetical protein